MPRISVVSHVTHVVNRFEINDDGEFAVGPNQSFRPFAGSRHNAANASMSAAVRSDTAQNTMPSADHRTQLNPSRVPRPGAALPGQVTRFSACRSCR